MSEGVLSHAVRRGAYYDSVVLMQLQRGLAARAGVDDAGVVMATPANLELLAASGLLPGEIQAGPDDLLVVVRAADEDVASEALGAFDELLESRRRATAGTYRPHTLEAALEMLPAARWVLISVPGRYAGKVARQALAAGKNVFLYSDNVAVETEVELKTVARENGLLVMGPDCGTAIVGGVGLGFANRVEPGRIGFVGASGTGLQAVTSRLEALGEGVSQVLGTGGRDLSAAVAGATALAALDLLARDDETDVIVLISKPPDPATAAKLLGAAQATGKPVVVYLQGHATPARQLGNLHFATGLEHAAEIAVAVLGEKSDWASDRPAGSLRGLFSGGTLASELLLSLRSVLPGIRTNLELEGTERGGEGGHVVLDLGEDEFTVGRPHPMLDYELRLRYLGEAILDPEVGMITLDVVLGEGSHEDPATELVPAIRKAVEAGKQALVLLVGTTGDPQDRDAQKARLEEAGAAVVESTEEAATRIAARYGALPDSPARPVPLEAIRPPVAAINIGLEAFSRSLEAQEARVVQVDWRPPAGGNERLAAILARLEGAGT